MTKVETGLRVMQCIYIPVKEISVGESKCVGFFWASRGPELAGNALI